MRIFAISGAALAAAFFLSAGAVSAATCTSSAIFSLDNASGAECFTGNDTNQVDASFSMFGMTGWILGDKNDEIAGTGGVKFGTTPVNDDEFGAWSVVDMVGAGIGNIVVTLKAGNGFGAFLISDLGPGTWTSSKELSHASVYYKDGEPPVYIPLPAASWLMIGGLGGLLALHRKKKPA